MRTLIGGGRREDENNELIGIGDLTARVVCLTGVWASLEKLKGGETLKLGEEADILIDGFFSREKGRFKKRKSFSIMAEARFRIWSQMKRRD